MGKVDIEQMIRDESAKLWEKFQEQDAQTKTPLNELIQRYFEKAMLIGCVMGKTEDFDLVGPFESRRVHSKDG